VPWNPHDLLSLGTRQLEIWKNSPEPWPPNAGFLSPSGPYGGFLAVRWGHFILAPAFTLPFRLRIHRHGEVHLLGVRLVREGPSRCCRRMVRSRAIEKSRSTYWQYPKALLATISSLVQTSRWADRFARPGETCSSFRFSGWRKSRCDRTSLETSRAVKGCSTSCLHQWSSGYVV